MTGIRGNALEQLLSALKSSVPTRQSITVLLSKHAPALVALFATGWTDEEIVAAFVSASDDESDDGTELRRLLRSARKLEKEGRKKARSNKQRLSPPNKVKTKAAVVHATTTATPGSMAPLDPTKPRMRTEVEVTLADTVTQDTATFPLQADNQLPISKPKKRALGV